MQYRCWKHNLIMMVIVIIVMLVGFAACLQFSEEKFYLEGFVDGYGEGWVGKIRADDKAPINCANYWRAEHKRMEDNLDIRLLTLRQ